jgi:hypothetical protein
MSANPYLCAWAKPQPKYLPGELIVRADGIFLCQHIQWLPAGWVYILVDV